MATCIYVNAEEVMGWMACVITVRMGTRHLDKYCAHVATKMGYVQGSLGY